MIKDPSIWGALKDLANNDIWHVAGNGAPTNAITGAELTGKGSTYTDTATGTIYRNTGTKASPTWTTP